MILEIGEGFLSSNTTKDIWDIVSEMYSRYFMSILVTLGLIHTPWICNNGSQWYYKSGQFDELQIYRITYSTSKGVQQTPY